MRESVQYTLNIRHEDGIYWANIEQIPGCFATGDSMDELMTNMAEAVGLALSTPESTVHAEFDSSRFHTEIQANLTYACV